MTQINNIAKTVEHIFLVIVKNMSDLHANGGELGAFECGFSRFKFTKTQVGAFSVIWAV